jgi:hypothetical protein
MMKSAFLALSFCFLSYVILTILAMNIFGEHNIQQSIFENLKQDQSNPLSIGIRLLFLVIFLCNIPYLFFPGKLSVLNVYQEYKKKCFSEAIERRMKKTDLEMVDDADEEPIDVVALTDDLTYYSVCFTFLLAIIISAILIDDLTVIFGMIAACSESLLNFVFPGLFFIIGAKNPKPTVIGFVGLGLIYFMVSNYYNLIKVYR